MSLTATAKLTSKATTEGQAKKTALRVESKPPAKQTADTEEATAERTREASPYTHNFGIVPLYPGRQPFVQPKLTVNKPGDKYEQEADSMADKVMRMAEPSAGEVLTGNIGDVVQRKCEACEEEDKDKDKKAVMRKEEGPLDDAGEQAVMRKEENSVDTDKDDSAGDGEVMRKEEGSADTDDDGEVMRKEDDSADTDDDDAGDGDVMRKEEDDADTDNDDAGDDDVMRKEEDPNTNAKNDDDYEDQVMREAGKPAAEPQAAGSWQSSLNSSKSGGAPLPAGTKRFMESAFQTDFSSVRVHTDSRAAEMSKGIQARAFTHGSDIYFNTGQFTPENAEGKRLLAHELTHVLQQQNGVATSLLQRKMNNGVGGGSDAAVLSAPAIPTPAVAAPQALTEGGGVQTVQPSAKQNPGATPGGGAGKTAPGNEKGKEVKPVEKDKIAEPAKADTSSTTAYLASLQHQQPIDFVNSIKNADADVNKMHGKEKEELQKDMPVIDQPTGLPTLEKTIANRAAMELAASKKAAKAKKDGGEKPKADTTPAIKISEKPIVKTPPALAQPQVDDRGVFEKALTHSIASLPTTDESISASLGPRPKPNLTGDANPDEINQETIEQEALVVQQQTNADQLTKQDFGENNVYPNLKPGKLRPEHKLTPVEKVKGEIIKPPVVTPEVTTAFNNGAVNQIQTETAAQVQKNDEAAAQMQDDKDKEKKNKMREIDEQTELVKQKQQKEQAKAKKEVTEQRETWTAENEKITKQYNDSAKAESDSTNGQIDARVKKGNEDVEATYKENEDKIADEKAKADVKAADKKKEAEEKQESGGFFSAIGDFLSDVWDSIKDAVNFIFDELRKAVKFIIEKAKQLADAIIDAVRDFAVGLIKAFGAVLKTFVNVAFAAFPGIAKKINGYIDKAVDYSVDAVNKWADDLKAAVNKLLDALGAALDFILSVYQKAFNLLIDALKFLTVGLMKILQGIAYLVEAQWKSVDFVVGALAEEALGADVTQPLPNIERSDEEIAQFASKYGDTLAGPAKSPAGLGNVAALQSKQRLSDDDVATESPAPVVLEPEVVAQANSMQWQGDTLELGGAGADAVKTSDLQEQAFGGDTKTDAPATDGQAAGNAPAPAEKADDGFDWLHKTDDEKLDYHIAQMGQEQPPADAKEEKPRPENDKDIPIEVKTGRLGVGKRLAFMGRQMVAGMKMFWSQHKVAIIAGLVGALLAAGAVMFFTGGAGLLAVVEVLMEALSLYFAASAILKAKDAVFNYVKEAFNGFVVKGAKSFAQGLAIIVVNFLLDYVLEGLGKVLTKIKNAIKGTKVYGKVAGAIATGIEKGKGLLIKAGETRIGGAFVKSGKFVLSGIEKGLGKGSKKIEELREKILSKFGFKRLWLERHGHWLELWGEFNSKVLLARDDGSFEIHDIPRDKITKTAKGEIKAEINGVKKTVKKVKSSEIKKVRVTDPKTKLSYETSRIKGPKGKDIDVVSFNKHGVNEDVIPIFPSGRRPGNAKEFAGKEFPLEGSLGKKYGSVPYTKEGFPDFEAVMRKKKVKMKKVEVEFSGDSATDIRKANEKAFGRSSSDKSVQTGFEEYTWHHSHDGKHLILIPSDLHDAARHAGGDVLARARLGLDDFD